MFGNKKIILTATSCSLMEQLRSGVEILTGLEVKFANLTINRDHTSGRGTLLVGLGQVKVTFARLSEEVVWFRFGNESGPSYEAKQHRGEVWISDRLNAHKQEDGTPLLWVGLSRTERREVPINKMFKN